MTEPDGRAWSAFTQGPSDNMSSRRLRRAFGTGVLTGLRIVWPVLSALLGLITALGLIVGMIEGWPVHESL